mmetsp:Transcript_22509/g.46912  ORF Transcript_22509/g.46912 Transcript_22509/m.46912 type:complete len:267 (-) Transcript_22509:397-1197(-)
MHPFIPYFIDNFLLIRTMSIIHGVGYDISDTGRARQEHDQTIKSHTPSTMRSGTILPQINVPLQGTGIHLTFFHHLLHDVITPFTHGSTKQFANEGGQQIKGFTSTITHLFHVKGFNITGPMSDKNKGSVFLHQILFVFRTQIFPFLRIFLELEFDHFARGSHGFDLVTQILLHFANGIGVLDADKGFVEQTFEVISMSVKFGRTRGFVTQKIILFFTALQDGFHQEFHVPFGLAEQIFQGDKILFVFHVQKFRQMFNGIGFFGTK